MSPRLRLLLLASGAQFLLVLDVTIVGVALPAIRSDLRLETAELQWVVSGYVLAFGGLLLSAGRLSDVLGRRRLFLAGLTVLALGSAACALAPSGAALVAARAVQGAGAALATPAALALVTRAYPAGGERARALGAFTAAAPVGGATGLLLGGVLTQAFGWRAIFVAGSAVTCVLLAAAPAVLPAGTQASHRSRLDLPGAAAGTTAVAALIFALTRIEHAGTADPGVVAALSVAALAAVAFAACERRGAEPLLPPGSLRSPQLRRAVLVSLTLTATTSPPFFFVALHLQGRLGWSATATGLVALPLVGAVVAGSALAPRAIARHGTTTVMAAGLSLIAAGVALLTAIPSGIALLVPAEALYGAGLGAGSVAATTSGTSAVAAHEQGLGAGLLNASAQVGTALGLALLVSIAGLASSAVDGMRVAFAADAALAAAAAGALTARRFMHAAREPARAGGPAARRHGAD